MDNLQKDDTATEPAPRTVQKKIFRNSLLLVVGTLLLLIALRSHWLMSVFACLFTVWLSSLVVVRLEALLKECSDSDEESKMLLLLTTAKGERIAAGLWLILTIAKAVVMTLV